MCRKVSFITPVYNTGRWLELYLCSLLEQDYPSIEFIFVNDGSTDNSEEILLSFQSKFEERGFSFLYIGQENKGQSAAINAGLQLASGEYLAWADSDDWLHKENVSAKAIYLDNHPECGLVRCNGVIINNLDKNNLEFYRDGEELATEADKHDCSPFERIFTGESYCHAGCYMLRLNILREIYGKDGIIESEIGQNLQMLLPVADRVGCDCIDRILFVYNVHYGSHAHRLKSYKENIRRAKNIYFLRLEILDKCGCDKVYYSNLAKSLYDKDMNKISSIYAKLNRARIQEEKRKAIMQKKMAVLHNHNFTILTNNCIAGQIYHDLGMQFLSPTINIKFNKEDFLIYLKYLKQFSEADMYEDMEENKEYPVGILKCRQGDIPPVRIHFVHYDSYEQGRKKWLDRTNRINYNNIYIIMSHKSGDEKILKEFGKLPYKYKVVLTDEIHANAPFCYGIPGIQSIDNLLAYKPGTAFRYFDEFDYISFLNQGVGNEKENRNCYVF